MTASAPSIDERKFVVALARGLDLLRAFRPGETLLGNRDFVERTGLPKATVNRLAYTLTVLGYLRFDEALGKYALDAGVLSLGFALLSGTDTLELARPHLIQAYNNAMRYTRLQRAVIGEPGWEKLVQRALTWLDERL